MPVDFVMYLKSYSQLEDGKEYKYLEPTQKPINPPYKTALAAKRGQVEETVQESKEDTTLVEESISSLSIKNDVSDSESK